MTTQKHWVAEQLQKYGSVSRNQCLQRNITRLSAIILSLKGEGYDFAEPKWVGNDYHYFLKDTRQPFHPKWRIEIEGNVARQIAL